LLKSQQKHRFDPNKNATAKGGEDAFGAAGGGQSRARGRSPYSVPRARQKMNPPAQPLWSVAQWDQIDWNAKLWRIPAEIMKMKEAHLVPLSRQAIELLQALAPLTSNADHIFPSLTDRHKPISENTMLYALVRLGYRGRMSVHGFRTSASTLLNEHGHHPDVIEAALAHTHGDIRSIYNRAKYLPERVKMYQWWADYCDELRAQKIADDATVGCSAELPACQV
jgi:hypothetical protein